MALIQLKPNSHRMVSYAGFYLTLFLVVAAVIVWQMPAYWVAAFFSGKPNCRLVIHQAQGSIWNGSAAIGGSILNTDLGICREPHVVSPRIHWVSSCSLSAVNCTARLMSSALSNPLELIISPNGLSVGAGEITLSMHSIEMIDGPWSTIKPRGTITMKWSGLFFSSEHLIRPSGVMQIALDDVSSVLSLVKPLGSYDVDWELASPDKRWTLRTKNGPLLLDGSGKLTAAGMTFSGVASASMGSHDALAGLLALLGRRQGDSYVLHF